MRLTHHAAAAAQNVADDDSTVKMWLMPTGTILCVDQRFTDWFGRPPADIVGKPFTSLAKEPELLQKVRARQLECLSAKSGAMLPAGRHSGERLPGKAVCIFWQQSAAKAAP